MLKSLKNDTPLEFLKKYKIKYDTETFQKFSYYESIIFNLEDKEKIKAEELNIDRKEIMNAILKNIEEIQVDLMNLAGRKTANVDQSNSIKIGDNEDDLKLKNTSTYFPPKKNKNKMKTKKIMKKMIKKIIKKNKTEKMPKNKTESKDLVLPEEHKLPNNKISPSSNKEQPIKKSGFLHKVKSIFVKEKAKPGLKGLKNVGAACYMNATLQCFSN